MNYNLVVELVKIIQMNYNVSVNMEPVDVSHVWAARLI